MPKLFSWFDFRKIFNKDRQPWPRQASIYRALPLGMMVVVAVTVFVGGISATGLLWWQVENQVNLRVLSAQSSTQALYSAEKKDILQFVQLVSDRPTLCALLTSSQLPQLTAYLEVLRRHTTADALVIIMADGQRIVSGSVGVSSEVLLEPSELPFADFFVLEQPTRLAVIGVSAISSAEGCENERSGHLIAVQVFDHEFMRGLASDTGLEQSLIVGERRISTSFSNMTVDWPLDPDAVDLVLRKKETCCTTGASGDQKYYVGLAPLVDRGGDVIALSEVALPANAIRSGASRAIALILGISILAGLVGGALTFPLSRRITDPLYRLSDAAERMGSGDLETPIPISSGWITIDRLASQLDHARRNLRQTQQITRRELRRIVHLLGATREGAVTINVEGHITWANSDACHILGYDVLDLLRRHYSDIFRPPAGEVITLKDILRPLLGQPVPAYLAILNSRGLPITLSVSHSRMDVGQDEVRDAINEHILIIKDVSEEQAINQLRSEFLANVAHEFRTPLSAISASTELLVEEGHEMDPDEVLHLAHTIHLSTVHLQTLVNNLLESAIIDAGLFHLRYRPISLPEFLRAITQMMSPLLQRRQQRLKVEIPEDMPCIWGDSDRLNQALVNLIENASKFSPSAAAIGLSVSQETDTVTFAVLDSGSGLPSGRFGDLFKRFVTGARSGAVQYGVGLGLPIVKAIAEAHGGHVGAENRPEGGARVWFVIPLKGPSKQGDTA